MLTAIPNLKLSSQNYNVWYTKPPASSTALSLIQTTVAYDIPLFVITATMQEAQQLKKACQFFDPTLNCLIFPAWETLPYDHFSPHQEIISDRLLALRQLPDMQRGIMITPINTLLERLPPKSYLLGHVFSLKVGQTFSWDIMRTQLQLSGYHCVQQVTLPGEYATRGSLFDVFPMGASQPFRIDLFDDEIEAIKQFDPETQRSGDFLTAIEFLPAHEFPLNPTGIETFRQNFREAFALNPSKCTIYQAISQGETPPGIEYYLSLFFLETATIFDYLPANSLIVSPNTLSALAQQEWRHIRERYDQLCHDVTRPILPPAKVFLNIDELQSCLKQFKQCQWVSDPEQASEKQRKNLARLAFEPLPDLLVQAHLAQPFLKLIKFIQQKKTVPVLFCAETPGRLENLFTLLKPIFPQLIVLNSWHDFFEQTKTVSTLVAITLAPLDDGFNLPDTLCVIPEASLFGAQVIQSRKRKSRHFNHDLVIRNLAELCVGDPIVHIDQGIGRYQGLEILCVGTHEGEFLKIQYDGGNLYVPVNNMHLVSRYNGVDTEHAPLHRLGSDVWEKAKRKAMEQIRDVAAELLMLYATRAAQQGFCHQPPDDHYLAFTAAFAFEETQDQISAIDAVTKDMTSSRPMDRLICGDVGFGKTEVAMRAAFLAVQSGKQVAILVPTTLLAQQHFDSFSDRFAAWPIKVDVLSRFRHAKEQKLILEQLAQGKIDILIGTHKLLSKEVQFADLGLLIVDEEHRFGVRQKEALKKWRNNVDVLAMTATPIPRSLNMAMAAIRDLSIIATPPAKRLAIKTFVREFNWPLLREAIQREVLRGGQVYFLHNEVASIERMADELRTLVPEARIAVAHGQLSERALEQIMADFYHQRFNVLVCSTIIETGLDVPNANTIIINRADKFGLAQLHQLRGRVGRSHHQAYAYLFTPPNKLLTTDAQKRLEAIEALEELGAGFVLATHDLEIRGAGELLGEGQSGHIQAIGYTLYTELLDRTVKSMQQGLLPEDVMSITRGNQQCEIDLQIPAFLPETYINDVNTRLIFYKRIATTKDQTELSELKIELIDRFGSLPHQVNHLFSQAKLRWFAQTLGIKRIEATELSGRIEFVDHNTTVDPAKIIHLLQTRPKEFKLEGPNRLKFVWPDPIPIEQRIDAVEKLLKLLLPG